MHIAVDLMGSDQSPLDLFDAAWALPLRQEQSIRISFLATPDIAHLIRTKIEAAEVVECSDAILPDEPPASACKQKPDASLMVGIRGLRQGRWDGLVTAGNSGATIIGCALELEPIPGCSRPGLLAQLPSKSGPVIALDVGGSLCLRPNHLLEFAQLGIEQARHDKGISCCRVGLLNIGVEPLKGTRSLQRAYQKLYESMQERPDVTFVGNVEGAQVYGGEVDVLLTDGFTGNVFLKASEGIASYILSELEGEVEPEILEHVRDKVDYERSCGAIVAGVKGTVIKCHGYSTPRAFQSGIEGMIHRLQSAALT